MIGSNCYALTTLGSSNPEMQYPCPHIPELTDLLEILQRFRVPVHLRGYLNSDPEAIDTFPFVDIDHECAENLQVHLPPGLRFIYPFPLSSQACIEGRPDPLQECECRDLAMSLRDYRPQGYPEAVFERCFDGLVDQAQYVLRHAPSRLVLTGQEGQPPIALIERWLSQSA